MMKSSSSLRFWLEEEVSVLITNSNIKHELTGGEYAERRRQCESALGKLDLLSWRDVRLADVTSATTHGVGQIVQVALKPWVRYLSS